MANKLQEKQGTDKSGSIYVQLYYRPHKAGLQSLPRVKEGVTHGSNVITELTEDRLWSMDNGDAEGGLLVYVNFKSNEKLNSKYRKLERATF